MISRNKETSFPICVGSAVLLSSLQSLQRSEPLFTKIVSRPANLLKPLPLQAEELPRIPFSGFQTGQVQPEPILKASPCSVASWWCNDEALQEEEPAGAPPQAYYQRLQFVFHFSLSLFTISQLIVLIFILPHILVFECVEAR